MTHTLSVEQLEGFQNDSLLASSTKERKKLVISNCVAEDKVESQFRVYHMDKMVYWSLSLKNAIEAYNAITEHTPQLG